METKNAKELQEVLTKLTEHMQEGVHYIDSSGRTLIYNEAMAKLEETDPKAMKGKSFRENFPDFAPHESTMERALAGKETLNLQQTYTNQYGKEITTINTTFPVTMGGEVIGAIEIANDITSIKTMSDTLMVLREERYKTGSKEFPRIRHYTFNDLIGKNEEFVKLVELAKKTAASKTSVFIYGETGTGKELFAQAMHYGGPRQSKPFIAQNCAALPESLLEGILFGTAKGGFTGAVDRAGLFEQADGGTLLLDEISAMPYDLQSKLLRVLQEDYVRRVGGTKDIPIDVRIIANVNRPPTELLESGALRKDLYYRLNIVNLNIPPLRERRDDIELLAVSLLDKQCKRTGKRIPGFSKEAMDKLQKHSFPGNVRELENIIASSVALGENGEELSAQKVIINNLNSQPDRNAKIPAFDAQRDNLDEFMSKTESEIISEIMKESGGNISKAAASLGIKRQTLQHKLKKYCK